jgi:hypothetical protein
MSYDPTMKSRSFLDLADEDVADNILAALGADYRNVFAFVLKEMDGILFTFPKDSLGGTLVAFQGVEVRLSFSNKPTSRIETALAIVGTAMKPGPFGDTLRGFALVPAF